MRQLPMFPLGTVLLPHRVLPLHLFEPRYRALIRDVLAGDGEFGVVLISRGHEVGGGDERTATGCAAKVIRAEELDDGRWLVLAVGVRRIRVCRWLPDDPYPRAEVEDLEDDHGGLTVADVRERVESRLRRVLALQAELGEIGAEATFELVSDPVVACWQVAGSAPLTPLDAQRLLETDACDERLRLLNGFLEGSEQLLEFRIRTL